jgi:glycosyltransferase involved in cell wall biosynthesis
MPVVRHVGINLVWLVPGQTGGLETYAGALIRALREMSADLRITTFLSRDAAAAAPAPWTTHADPIVMPVSPVRRVEWVRGEQQLLPRAAARAGVQLVHSLASTGPAWGRFRRVTTVHDLIYRHVPEAHFGVRSLGMRVLVPLVARRSDRVIAVSRTTRDDIVELLHLPPDRIDVVPNGVTLPGTVAPTPTSELRERFDLGERRLLLTAAAKRPHKNLMRLLDALALLDPAIRPVLVLPGYPTPHERELRARTGALRLAGDVRFLAWVSREDMEGLYAAADAFVFPSLYEGFGLPVLEAMERGVPVACSGTGALAEVAGDAALTFDPLSVREIADALTALLTEPARVQQLRELGRRRASEFTWACAARGTLASYERALSR